MLDNYRSKGLRKKLVKTLIEKGISDKLVLEAINAIPRHLFLDSAFMEHAYKDKAFPIGKGQTISHPYTVAYQTETLGIKKGDKVLEIGTGSGYQTCVLAQLGADIYTIERHKELSKNAKKIISSLGFKATYFTGDGTKGIPEKAPFDKIIVTAGAPIVSQSLIEQLNVNGKLLIPIGDKDTQTMNLITKDNSGQISHSKLEKFQFVPLIGEEGW